MKARYGYLTVLISILLLAWSAGPAAAQAAPEQLADLTATGAKVFAASRGAALGPPSATPAAAVESFLRAQKRPQATINTLVPASEQTDSRTGVTHLRYRQVLNGLDVYGTYLKAAVNGRRELVHLVDVVPDVPPVIPGTALTPLAALQAAAASLYPGQAFQFRQTAQRGNTTEFATGDAFFFQNPTATRVVVPLAGAAMQEGWLVETWTATGNQLHHTVVGNGGRILLSELRTAQEDYRVFKEHPVITLGEQTIGTNQTVEAGPSSSNESPSGWVSTHGRTAGVQSQYRLSGNNVYAYLDRDNNNQPDAAGSTITNGAFTAVANLDLAPTLDANPQVAIQNLFWASNIIHDKLYLHGFNEAAGNFQQTNFTGAGRGNDSLYAEAQDGGGTDNANFSTPSDGSSPRMQMYLWTKSNPSRDGDVDTDIVYHEYGHGLTWRMIGSMSGCMSGAIGEGASDSVSILMNGDDVVGEYSYNNVKGIRRYPYTNYPLTYNDLSGSSVHANGELLGAILWRAREYFLANNIALDQLWDYFVDGMNHTPAGPRFEDFRDGMVQSAVNRGLGHQCRIWRAFADYGVGVGASGSCGGIFTIRWTVSESFAVPAECGGNTAPTVSIVAPAEGTKVSGPVLISISATDQQDAAGTLTVEYSTDGSNWLPAPYNGVAGRYEATWDSTPTTDGTRTIYARASDSGGLKGSDTNTVVVDNVADAPIHVGDLDGSTSSKPNSWNASVTIAVHNALHAAVSGVVVSGAWSGGATGTASCTTGSSGTCTVTKNSLSKKTTSVTFTITGLAATNTTYQSPANHDVDGGTNGTVITLIKP